MGVPGCGPQWARETVVEALAVRSLERARRDPRLGRPVAQLLAPRWLQMLQADTQAAHAALAAELRAVLQRRPPDGSTGRSPGGLVYLLWASRSRRYVGKTANLRKGGRGLLVRGGEHLRGNLSLIRGGAASRAAHPAHKHSATAG